MLLGTEGHISPKGDDPGFVRVLDDNRSLIPDRSGNNRRNSFRNILVNPNVGLLFMVRGNNRHCASMVAPRLLTMQAS